MKKISVVICIAALLIACNNSNDHSNMEDYYKPVRGDYWATRYSYPTFQYRQDWLVEAKVMHNRNLQKSPARKNRQSDAFNGMDPNAFIALGPKPLGNPANTAFSGRVNVIVSHPVDDNIAYAGVDGGGVWKTTDCCDEETTWNNITDTTEINGAAIGDLHLDPNDADIIYAGTGDLRYGSYSFGSAGLLRSKDAGLTWEVLGESEFAPYLEQPLVNFLNTKPLVGSEPTHWIPPKSWWEPKPDCSFPTMMGLTGQLLV